MKNSAHRRCVDCRSSGGGYHDISHIARRSGSSRSFGGCRPGAEATSSACSQVGCPQPAAEHRCGDGFCDACRRRGNPCPCGVRDHPLTPRAGGSIRLADHCVISGCPLHAFGGVLVPGDVHGGRDDNIRGWRRPHHGRRGNHVDRRVGAVRHRRIVGSCVSKLIPVRRRRRHFGGRRCHHCEPRRGFDLVAGVSAWGRWPTERCLVFVGVRLCCGRSERDPGEW